MSQSTEKSITRNNINFLRRLTRTSQSELSILMSHVTGNVIDTTTISKHENGSRNPQDKELQAYARIFKVPVKVLYRDVCSQQELLEFLKTQGGDWLFDESLIPEETA